MLMKEECSHTFCCPYATYTIDLILEEIGSKKKERLRYSWKGKSSLTGFIYIDNKTLSMMCHLTKKNDFYMSLN